MEFIGSSQGKDQNEDRSFFRPAMKFLTNFKKYVLNKMFAHKYETTPDQSESDVSVLSYKELEFDSETSNTTLALNSTVLPVPTNFTLTVDKKLLEAIETVVNQKRNSEGAFLTTPGKLELLQIIEKTFERQLGIFEELLYLVEENKKNKEEKTQKIRELDKNEDYRIEMEKSVNGFLKDLLKNISVQLSNVADNMPKPIGVVEGSVAEEDEDESENYEIALDDSPVDLEPTSPEAPQFPFSPFGGDNFQVKPQEVECECNNVNGSGGAAPLFSFISEEEEPEDELLDSQ